VRCLLDTNVISELRKIGDGKANTNVVSLIREEDSANFVISTLTILELERGKVGIQQRDLAQGARLRAWLHDHVRREFAGRILPATTRSPRAARICTSLICATRWMR